MVRVNGRIRAREVRVIGEKGEQVGVLTLPEAIKLARSQGLDLVEIAPNGNPPVCRVVDYGKFRYEQSKKDRENRKHQHGTKVKEVQLRPSIDKNDFGIKLNHAIEFLCEDNKVKISLRFRGRENAHKEFGFQTLEKFIKDLEPYGHPDFPPKLMGRGLNAMISPLPKSKRADNPNKKHEYEPGHDSDSDEHDSDEQAPRAAKQSKASADSKDFNDNPVTSMDSATG